MGCGLRRKAGLDSFSFWLESITDRHAVNHAIRVLGSSLSLLPIIHGAVPSPSNTSKCSLVGLRPTDREEISHQNVTVHHKGGKKPEFHPGPCTLDYPLSLPRNGGPSSSISRLTNLNENANTDRRSENQARGNNSKMDDDFCPLHLLLLPLYVGSDDDADDGKRNGPQHSYTTRLFAAAFHT